jgi:two-component system phosphate regulon sensor histidine kinase PhoR
MLRLPSTVWPTILVCAGLQLFITVTFVVLGGFLLTPAEAAAASGLRAWLWGLGLTSTAASVIYWLAVGRRMVAPVQQFSEAAGEIGRGEYRQLARLRVQSEPWAALGVALAEMADAWSARERGLREAVARMNAILASLREGVLATGPDGRVTMANDAACEMLSKSRDELVGHGLLETVRYGALRTAIAEAQRMKTPRSIELETLDFSGPRRWLQASVTVPAEPVAGGVAVVLHDLTGARRMERMRRDFVANVSHELKTPLAAIRACAETLRMGALHDESANMGFVEQIENQARTLSGSVQRLLELSQAQAGLTAMDLQRVDLYQSCVRAANDLMIETDQRGIRLEVEPAAEPVEARADLDAVRTILDNLLANAIRYTPEGGSITVAVRNEDRSSTILEVTDTGPGIAPEHQERIFERFYRVDRARSREHGGIGLGLAIVKHLAQTMGGSVELVSRLGHGCTFRVRLPMA